jgi:capsular exopolysaccharide synthesis family protein
MYQSTVTLLVSPSLSPGSSTTDNSQILGAENLATTYAELARSRPVLEAALAQEQSGLDYDTAVQLVDAAPIHTTQLLQVSARNSDPQQAQTLANDLADALVNAGNAAQADRFSTTRDSLSRQLQQVSTDLDARTQDMAALNAQPPSVQRDVEITRLETQIGQLQQARLTIQQSYDNALMRSSDILEVVDRAQQSQSPLPSSTTRNVVLAAFLGLLLAIGVAVLFELLDDRLLSAERLTRRTGLPVLGTIATLRAETFRLLAANIQFTAGARQVRSLLISSCQPREGRTTAAVNLAVALASTGKKVALIDADLSRPKLHRAFRVPQAPGLTSLLTEPRTQDPLRGLVASGLDGLQLVPAGPVSEESSALLASQRMRDLVSELEHQVDVVVIDAAPVLSVTDVAVLAANVSAVLLIVDTQQTRAEQVQRAANTLQGVGAWVIGGVLNRVPTNPDTIDAQQEPVAAADLAMSVSR